MRLLSLTETKKLKDVARDQAVQTSFAVKQETEKARIELLRARAEAEVAKKEIALSHDQFIETLQRERLALNAELIELREQTREPLRRMAEEETRLAILRDEVRQETVLKTELLRKVIQEEARLDAKRKDIEALERETTVRAEDIESRSAELIVLEAEAEVKVYAASKREQEVAQKAEIFAQCASDVEKDLVDREAACAALTQELGRWREDLETKEKELRSKQRALANAFKELEKKRNR